MKNLLLSFVLLTGLAACNNTDKKDTTERNIQLLRDSTVYTNNNMYSDTVANVVVDEPVIEKSVTQKITPKAPKKKVVSVPAKKENTAPVYVEKQEEKVEATVATPPINSGSNESTGVGSSDGNTASVPGTTQKKKGWDKATTGAVIGGAAGAAGGAIIVSKKKGLGAVVGAVVGAASGYIIGKDMDKKDTKK